MQALALEDVSFRYAGASTAAVRDLTLEVEEGTFVLLAGPSGSGKSTVLRLLNGLIPHFYRGHLEGRIRVLRWDTRETRPNRLGTRVGTVFQFPEEQIVAARVWRDVAFGLENLLVPREEILQRIEGALEFVGLTPLRDRQSASLSGGEKQRLALASVLAMDPPVLLLDEPASELDPRGRREFLQVLDRLKDASRRTVVVADHRLEDLLPLADRLVVLSGGRPVADGPPRTVLAEDGLAGLGVEVPVPVRMWHRLRDAGRDPGPCPLTAEELAASLGEGRGTDRGA